MASQSAEYRVTGSLWPLDDRCTRAAAFPRSANATVRWDDLGIRRTVMSAQPIKAREFGQCAQVRDERFALSGFKLLEEAIQGLLDKQFAWVVALRRALLVV